VKKGRDKTRNTPACQRRILENGVVQIQVGRIQPRILRVNTGFFGVNCPVNQANGHKYFLHFRWISFSCQRADSFYGK